MTIWPQEDHADLGLVEDDNTPDMRKTPVHSAKERHRGLRIRHHEEADLT